MSEDNTIEQFLGLIFNGAVVVMLLLVALNFSVKAAERGFSPHAQSILFDGAHRIISGQAPYRDFVMPYGPIAFWTQAVFSRMFGLDHFSCIFSAATLNVLATLFSVLIMRKLFPNGRFVSYLAGFLTAIWFAPPFGTLWMDHVAFFFSLFAVTAVLYGLPMEKGGRSSHLLFMLSGSAAFLSFASKQNIGIFMLPLCPMLLVAGFAPNRRSGLAGIGFFAAGLAGAFIAFLVWLLLASSPSAFWEQGIRMAGRLGAHRLFGDFRGLLGTLLLGRGPAFNRIITSAVTVLSIMILGFYLRIRRLTGYSPPALLIPPLVCIYLTLAQRLSIQTSAVSPENGFPLIGIILATAAGMLFYLIHSDDSRVKQLIDSLKPLTRRDARAIVLAAVLLSSLYVCISGVSISLNRDVQDSVTGSLFPQYMTHSKLLSLRWGSPTMVEDTDVTERDLTNILTYLTQSRKKFFVFPDFTVFYGLIGVPSSQPLLYFAPGETYSAGGDRHLDSLIVERLKENDVEIVVLEEKSVSDAELILGDLPLLKTFLKETFIKTGKIGIFHIYRKPEYGQIPSLLTRNLPA